MTTSTTTTGFPRDLLGQSNAARLNYFQQCTIAHPFLKDTFEKLRCAISAPADSRLIFVMGPAGVGKTKLRQRIERHLTEQMMPTLEKDPGRIPVAAVEAVGPDLSAWNWKDYYKRILRALGEPLIEQKKRPSLWKTEILANVDLSQRSAAAEYRYVVEQALVYRKPAAVLIDEAQHLTKIASGRKLQDQLDHLKSLANMTGTVHVLLGTYELLAFRNLSGQLCRRSVDIHFRRYRADCQEELRMFRGVVLSFQRQLPVEEEPDLLQHWEYLYERSLGCVGVLKDWLLQALAMAVESNARTLTPRHLESRALSISKCEKMLLEAVDGEARLEESAESSTRLRRLLGLNTEQGSIGEERTATRENHKTKAIRRPGTRNPKRDPVGREKSND